MRYPKKYQKQMFVGFIGLIVVFLPFSLKIPGQFKVFNTANQAEGEGAIAKIQTQKSEDVERDRVSQRSQTAMALAKAGVMPSTKVLKMRGYYDTPSRDPKPETTGFLAGERIKVVDSAGRCVGVIQNRKWLWKHSYPQFCK